MKLTANLDTLFQEHDKLTNRYSAAAAAGFRHVECASPYGEDADTLGALLQSLHLSQELISTPNGYACVPGKEDEFRAGLKEAIRYAKALHCPRIKIEAGTVPEGSLLIQVEAVFERNLVFAVHELCSEGITALIQPACPKSKPGHFLFSYDQALGYVQKIKEPNFKLILNCFQAHLMSGDVVGTFSKYQSHIGHIHAAQAPNGGPLDSSGHIDFAAFFKLLQAEGFDGAVGVNYDSKSDTAATLGWVQTYGLAL